MRVLVVDDEPVLLESLARSLRFEGYQVATAADGLEALEEVPDVRPDALVLDVMMPRLDGVEACRRLRARGDDYLVKPFVQEEPLARLRAMLRRSGGGGEPPNADERLAAPSGECPAGAHSRNGCRPGMRVGSDEFRVAVRSNMHEHR